MNGKANSLRTDMCLVSACKTQAQLWEEIKMLFPGLTAWLEGPAYQVDLAKTNRCCQRCKVKKEEFFLGWNQCLKLSFQSFQRCPTIFEKKTMESLLLAAEACFCSWMAYIRYVSPICSHRPSALPASKVSAPSYARPQETTEGHSVSNVTGISDT